jgi:transcriptional regulator with XRE-family HTH domain
MDTGFGQRLRAGMFAAGIATAEELAAMVGIPARTAKRYLDLERADINAVTAEKIARALRVRLAWLITGVPPVAYRQEAIDALIVLERMSPPKAKRWLAMGRRMADLK